MSCREPVVLSVAGSDCSGGAGLQCDQRTIEVSGARAATVVTAITVQTGRGVRAVHPLPAAVVAAQLEAVLADLPVAAAKTGMLATRSIVEVVAAAFETAAIRPVVDPVLAASDGTALLEDDALDVLRSRLMPLAALLTPNAAEASRLSGLAVTDPESAERAARRLLETGVAAVVVTGGHFERETGTDVLVTAGGTTRIPGAVRATPHTRGGGCAFAASVAAGLARGCTILEAVREARRLSERAIAAAGPLGAGRGPVEPRRERRA